MWSCTGTTSRVLAVSVFGGRSGLLSFKSFSSLSTSVSYLLLQLLCGAKVANSLWFRIRLLRFLHLLLPCLLPMGSQRWQLRGRRICCFCWYGHHKLLPPPLHLLLLRHIQEDRQDWTSSSQYWQA